MLRRDSSRDHERALNQDKVVEGLKAIMTTKVRGFRLVFEHGHWSTHVTHTPGIYVACRSKLARQALSAGCSEPTLRRLSRPCGRTWWLRG